MVLSPFEILINKRIVGNTRLGYSNYLFISCYSKASYDALKK